MNPQLSLDIHNKLIVDLFAGGGGMSTAFERAFGRSPDIAINHNDDALSMHRANHPQTRHFIADVFEVCPHGATQGRPVGWLHLSPDCTHHSQAAGGQPRDKKIRGLSWVGYRWAAQVAPDIISLENVKQITAWSPLIAKRDKATGRVVTLDMIKTPSGKMINRVADVGEHVPVQNQFLVPDKKRAGKTWRRFVRSLEALGYAVESRVLCAADFGGHTTRERLFMIARRDGLPIRWPEPTHFRKPAKGQKKWKAAAECIDFSLPCPSIFDRSKPLAEATNRRIAKGIKRYVLESAKPFIVPIAHYNGSAPVHSVDDPLRTITAATKGGEFALASPVIVPATHHGSDRANDIADPLPTITAAHRGELMLTTPILAKFRADSHGHRLDEPLPTITSGGDCARPAGAAHALGVISPVLVQTGYGERDGQAPRALDIEAPLGTVVGTGKHAVASALLVGVGGRAGQTSPQSAGEPINTITSKADTAIVTAHLAHLRGNCDARNLDDPVRTISAGGEHHGLVSAFLSRQFGASIGHDAQEPLGTVTAGGGGKSALVECTLSKADEAGALRVAAFLMRYYGEGGQWGDIANPMATITTKDRLALVTVKISGTPYVIVDIGLRMLQPRELFNGQDFPPEYIIERGHDGRTFSKSAQVRMCGNSVDPVPATAFLVVNAPELATRRAA